MTTLSGIKTGSIERNPEAIVTDVVKDIRTPKFTNQLIIDLDQENSERFKTLCDLFTKYRQGDSATDDRISVFSSSLKKKNDAFGTRQISSLPQSQEELAAENETVVTEFWDLLPGAYTAMLFVQRFHGLVEGLRPRMIVFPVLTHQLGQLANLKLPNTITSFQDEMVLLGKVEVLRYEAAKKLDVYVAGTGTSLDGSVPDIFRRAGRHNQIVGNSGKPISALSTTRLSYYQIPLPKVPILSESASLKEENVLVENPSTAGSSSSSSSSSTSTTLAPSDTGIKESTAGSSSSSRSSSTSTIPNFKKVGKDKR